jgi:hypothetical protein
MINGKEEGNLEAFIGEYLKNTNGLRDFMINKAKYDDSYSEWCGEQASHIVARQNHSDAGISSVRKTGKRIEKEIQVMREYDKE